MNLFEKVQIIKEELLKANLKKSGKNKFAGYDYYELADFMPTIIKLCNEHKVYTGISFNHEVATLLAVNAEEPNEQISITSPMEDLELKGCNKVQALGGVETYQRRYLYMALFDITENDMFDGTVSTPVEKEKKKYICEVCGAEFKDYTTKAGKTYTAGQMYEMSKKQNGKAICMECNKKESKGE